MKKLKIAIIMLVLLSIFVIIPTSFAGDNQTDFIGVANDTDVIGNDYYFDSSIENNTGDGSKLNPYKDLSGHKIQDNSVLYFSDGEYNLDTYSYIDNVTFIGGGAQNTVIKSQGKMLDVSSSLTLCNITFVQLGIQNYGNLTIKNSVFKNSLSTGFITSSGSDSYVNIVNSSFMDGHASNGGAININHGFLNIDDSSFSDNYATSSGGVIYVNGGVLNINNSIFDNNYATLTGGAINCENNANATIKKSRFSNNNALNDIGGAVYIFDSPYSLISDTEFINNSALFGGAVTSLKSELNLTNIKASNNKAKYYGGAVYFMYGVFTIDSSILDNNTAGDGGALYIDGAEIFNIHSNVFTNNHADRTAGAVYSVMSDTFYDSIFDKTLNNTFIGNSAQSFKDVYESNMINLTIGDNNYILIKYNPSYNGTLPSRYDLREVGGVTSVKSQDNGGNCWSFSSLAALESAILKATGKVFDLSEENMKNIMSLYSDYGWAMETNKGGYDKMGIGYLTSWLGPINDIDDVYNGNSKISPVLNSLVHVQNIVFLKRDNYTDNDAIKKAIMDYGAVSTSVYWSSAYYKNKINYYYDGNSGANHAVAIVGWDDTYSKSKFKTTPAGDGAWIIKNSWGTSSGENGYFYVSYYDTRLAQPGKGNSYAIVFNDTIRYDKNYQYDVQGRSDNFLNTTSTVWYKNKFIASDDEYLAAVSTYFNKLTSWDLSVYVNGALKLTQSGISDSSYSTIDLNEFIPLKTGDVFEIMFKISVDGDAGVPISEAVSFNYETYSENISFISYDGKTWKDFYDLEWKYPDHNYASQVACIKAFTILDKIDTNIDLNIVYDYLNDVSSINIDVYDKWGNLVRKGNVIINVNGHSYKKELVGGKCIMDYDFDLSSLNNITVSFEGLAYSNSVKTTQFSKSDIKTNVTFDIEDIEYGNQLMAYVLINDQFGNIVSGEVNLKINNQNYKFKVSDKKYYSIPLNLPAGSYNAELSSKFFESKKVDFTVYKSSASVTINTVSNWDALDVNISISNNINDTVSVNIFNENKTVNIVNGKAKLHYDNLKPGNYSISVYLKDNYKNNFKNSSFEINYENTTLEISPMTTYYNSGAEFKILLKDSNGKAIADKEVKISLNKKTIVCNTDKNGAAVYEIYLENGLWDIKVSFEGDDYYCPSSASSKITVLTTIVVKSQLTKTNGSAFTFVLLDTFGNPVSNYESSVEFDGENILVESDSKGIFSLDINKDPGSYALSIVNPINDEHLDLTLNVVKRMDSNKAITMYYGAGSVYKVRAFDDDGKVAAGVKVKFTIGGKTYTRTTDSSGYASFKITLQAGTYTITAEYKGYKVSNKVVVKPTLILSTKTVKKSKTFKYTVKLLNNKGKILKYKKVTVKFRGKTYTAKTNSKGIATFSIKSLSKTGKFTLTASYGSAKISKKITVKK